MGCVLLTQKRTMQTREWKKRRERIVNIHTHAKKGQRVGRREQTARGTNRMEKGSESDVKVRLNKRGRREKEEKAVGSIGWGMKDGQVHTKRKQSPFVFCCLLLLIQRVLIEGSKELRDPKSQSDDHIKRDQHSPFHVITFAILYQEGS